MYVRERQICYHELRALVIATSRYANSMAENAPTFSEGNASHNYKDLAGYLDELVVDSEPTHSFLVVNEEDILRERQSFAETCDTLLDRVNRETEAHQKKTVFIDQIRVALGVVSLPDDAILGMITTMREDIDTYEMAAEKAAKTKKKKK